MPVSARAWGWLAGASVAVMILVSFVFFVPRLSSVHDPRYLAGETDSHGFFSPETDVADTTFVWTEPQASTTFTLIGRQPVSVRLMLRSAAVAGGPDAPIRVMLEGQEVQRLRPDPTSLAFQAFQFQVPRTRHGRLTIELVAESFRPAKGDPRILGTMVQSITIDQHAAWSQVAQRYAMYGALFPLAALVAFFIFVAGRVAAAQAPYHCWSARAGYAAVIICMIAAACMFAMLSLLLRIGRIDAHRSLGWQLGTAYLGIFTTTVAVQLPWGSPGAPSIWVRLRHTPLIARHWQTILHARDVVLLVLPTILAFHFLRAPGTGDVQDKLHWMHSMATDGLVRGFQESQDDYPPGTYVVLFGFTKLALHLHIGFFLAYKASLLLFLLLSSAVVLAWTRAVPLAAAMQTALVVGTMALGYNDVYFIPFLLVALWALQRRKLVSFSLLFAVTCLMKWQPAVLAPVLLLSLFGTTSTAERRGREGAWVACRVILPAAVLLGGTFLLFGGEFFRELRRATSENFLSANALNADWIVTHILAWWNPSRFGFTPDTHRRFIRIPNAAVLALLKVPFFAVYTWILVRFARGPKSFGTALFVAYLGYSAYFLLNTSVHENHLVPAVVIGGLLAAQERRFLPLFLVSALVANINMVLFYGLDGMPRLPTIVRGVDISFVLAVTNGALFIALMAASGYRTRTREGSLIARQCSAPTVSSSGMDRIVG